MSVIKKTIPISLDLQRVTAQPQSIPTLVEGDNGNVLVITLTDDGVPVDMSGCKVLAVFSKVADGTTSEQDTQDHYVRLDDVGITLTGTPADADTITVTVSNGGQSLSAVTTVTGGSVTVDETFLERFPDDGTYELVYSDSDNTWVYGTATVTIGGADHNILTVLLKTSSYGAGKNNCEIQIYSGDDFGTLVTTAQFNFDGRRGITNPDTIRRSGEYPILASLITQAQKALQDALPYTNVIVTAVAGNSAGVTVTQTDSSFEMDFIIPNSVYVGDTEPTGDEEVWIIPQGDGEIEDHVMGTGTYDQNENGIVDNSEKLEGHAASYFATAAQLTAEASARDAAIASAVSTEAAKKGQANGYAALDSNTKVNAAQASARLLAVSQSRELALTDAGAMLYSNSSSAITITIPTNSDVAFPVGTEIEFCRWGSGALTIAAASGVNLYSANSLKSLSIRYATAGLKKISTNNWLLTGALA